MPILANAATFSPETVVQVGTAETLIAGLVTDHIISFSLEENEGWQILYIGMRFTLDPAANITVLGAYTFVQNGSQPAARAQAAVTQIQGDTAPKATFIITPSTPYGEVGPGRVLGMGVTLLGTMAGDDVFSSELVAEIRRFRLVTDPSVLTVQPERAQLDGLNLRLLNRR